jgi:hypothetical protein
MKKNLHDMMEVGPVVSEIDVILPTDFVKTNVKLQGNKKTTC